MKKILLAVFVLSVVAAFVPMAYADSNANLQLTVTFKPDEPLTLITDPAGPFMVEVGQQLRFRLIAEDKDAAKVMLHDLNLPRWIIVEGTTDSTNRIEVMLLCEPKAEDAQIDPYHFTFTAENDSGTHVTLTVDITIPVIAIELNQPTWDLTNIILGQVVDNIAYFGASEPIHKVKNTGNIVLTVEIMYGIMSEKIIHPGRSQGEDTFITGVGRANNHVLISPIPGEKTFVGMGGPGDDILLWLAYGAPTSLSQPAAGMSAALEVCASKVATP